MSTQMKISADTSEAKKSILDLAKSLKTIGDSKVAIFNDSDKKLLKGELRREMELMKTKLRENREEIKKMIEAQKGMIKGTQEELEIRKKILDSYKIQNRLAKEQGDLKKVDKQGFGGGGGGDGMVDKLIGNIGSVVSMGAKLLGGAALGAGIFAITKGIAATNQYVQGTPSRNRLKGLGVGEDSFGSPEQLANAGLNEQDMIKRRIEATSVLGREGTSNDTEMQKASFERAYGLQGGTMTGVASSLRGTMGGAGANDAQIKMQSTIMAAGIEDALGPYLDSMTTLLTSINENGTTSTSDIMGLMARLTKDGGRTPEQMGKTFSGINSAMQNSSGEANAFLQTAFARAGIGGGTIGGTKFALSSGGLFGMDQGSLAKRGYNPELLKNMGGAGMFSGVGKRTDAMMDLFKQAGGLGKGDSISGVKDVSKMVGMGNLANSVFGTKGNQGFDALMMLEKVQNKQMSSKEFDEQVKKMTDTKDPQAERLDKINSSLSGQTEILTNIDNNLAEALGKQGVTVRNAAKKLENEGTQGATNVMGAVNDTGIVEGAGNAISSAGHYLFGGGKPGGRSLGGDVYDFFNPDQSKGRGGITEDNMTDMQRQQMDMQRKFSPGDPTAGGMYPSAKDIGKEVANALRTNPPSTNVNVKTNVNMPMGGRATDRTQK
jgi:hypothetical protein